MATKTDKPKFDTEAFVFKTEISKIEEWLQKMFEDLDNPCVEYPTPEEQYWLGRWIADIEMYRNNNIPYTYVSAKESAVLGLYKKKETKSGKYKK